MRPARQEAQAQSLVFSPQSCASGKQAIQEADFRETMRQAYGGKLEPLHEYLRAFLLKDHADVIMEWAKRRLRQDLITKKPPKPKRVAADLIIAHVRGRLRDVRKWLGGHPLRRGEYQRLIDQSCTELAEDGDLDPADLEGIDN